MEEILRYVPVAFILGGYFFYFYKVKPWLEQRKRDAVDNRAPEPLEIDADALRMATPEEKPLLSALVKRDVGPLQAHLAGLTGPRNEGRILLCSLAAPMLDREILNTRCDGGSGQALDFLLRGYQGRHWAWQARGHGGADDVDARAAHRFEERMGLAERDLLRAAELDPADPTPHATLISVLGHLDEPTLDAEECLEEVLRRAPDHYLARSSYLNFFCAPHWGGSAERSLGFSREATAGAPPGSPLHLLVAKSHYDIWHNEQAFGDKARADAYVKDPAVVKEVLAAHAASLGHPAYVPTRNSGELRNLAAWWFFMIQDQARCAEELRHIGAAHTESCWQMLGPAEKQYAAARAWAESGKKWKRIGW